MAPHVGATYRAAHRNAHGCIYALGLGGDTTNSPVIDTTVGGSLYNQNSDNVVAGGGFIEVADSFADFGPVIQRKLIRWCHLASLSDQS